MKIFNSKKDLEMLEFVFGTLPSCSDIGKEFMDTRDGKCYVIEDCQIFFSEDKSGNDLGNWYGLKVREKIE